MTDDLPADLDQPPCNQRGFCSYIAATVHATPGDTTRVRQACRHRPIAVIGGRGTATLIAVLSPPQPVEKALAMARALADWTRLAPVAVAPAPLTEPRWSCPRLSDRDRIRIRLALAGQVDLEAFLLPYLLPIMPGPIANSAGTFTHVGAKK